MAMDQRRVTTLLRRWAKVWRLPGLQRRVDVHVSTRFTRSLGRSVPSRGQIRIHHALVSDPGVFAEVLCHEAAHVAAYELHGGKHKPHGAEWQDLVRAAGYEPTVRLSTHLVPQQRKNTSRAIYEHRCPVCQMVRRAKRPVKRWRCRACVEAGLEGLLEIHRHDK